MMRYQALDVLRGLTVAVMMLVNMPGAWQAVYTPLLHAHWHGWTLTDLVFPFFLFVIGSAMYFSLKKSESLANNNNVSRIFKRAFYLFSIGLMLNALWMIPPNGVENLRIMGVMQRISLAYLIGGLLILCCRRSHLYIVSLLILVGYSSSLAWYSESPYSLQDNLVRFVDMSILGEAHMYQLRGIAFEPEGLLSTLPAVVNILFGFEITRVLNQATRPLVAVKKLTLICAITFFAAIILQNWIPINKYLWTSSYVLFTSAWATGVLLFLIWILDIKGRSKFAFPFIVFGLNPLFIYVFHWVLTVLYYKIPVADSNLYETMYQWILAGDTANKAASLLFAMLQLLLLWMTCYGLYRRNIIIKL
ncbi:acyltransferase family protein [Catenovulum sediminis]|uniref:DUF5009 domain-containing protein n=1 Tax=Catenovulum sediminis TaxID=1740262 RepID=A0ABV1RHS0_9ALTE